MVEKRNVLVAVFLVGFFGNMAQTAFLRFFLGTFFGTELHVGTFLGIWLGGVAAGSALTGHLDLSLKTVLVFGLLSSPLVLMGILFGIPYFPALSYGFLPFWPVAAFMGLCLLPVSIPVGMLIPSAVRHSNSRMGELFAWESMGSFFSGAMLSLILGGKGSPVLLLLISPVFWTAALLMLQTHRVTLVGLFLLSFSGVTAFFSPVVINHFHEVIWDHFHPGIKRIATFDTPYQQIQIGDYQGQKSLYLDGTLSASWPDQVKVEERVHVFMTGLATASPNILLLGAPTPDLLLEFQKYPGLRLTIVELDPDLLLFLSSEAPPSSNILWKCADPRVFLRTNQDVYDGIMVLPSDPTTLLANRLFTREAFEDMRRRLTKTGVLSISIGGAENYLGSALEQAILSIHRTLGTVFPEIIALPGDPIIFWAATQKGLLMNSPEELGRRFKERHIDTGSFQSLSFSNLLQPFRVRELVTWLKRPTPTGLNEDAHPTAFARQIRLWDLFTDSHLGWILHFFEKADLLYSCMGLTAFLLLVGTLGPLFRPPFRRQGILVLSAGFSGFTGLLSELILILVYQNRHGAMFQMTAFFFGLYMFGLAIGAIVVQARQKGESVEHGPPATTCLPRMANTRKVPRMERFWRVIAPSPALFLIKASQVLCCLGLLIFVGFPDAHSFAAVTTGIFIVSFLAGAELVILDEKIQSAGTSSTSSAGRLFWSDNSGALLAAFLAGPWFLPTLSMSGTATLLALLMAGNLLLLRAFDR